VVESEVERDRSTPVTGSGTGTTWVSFSSTGVSIMTGIALRSISSKLNLNDNRGGPSLMLVLDEASPPLARERWLSSKEEGGVRSEDHIESRSEDNSVGDDFVLGRRWDGEERDVVVGDGTRGGGEPDRLRLWGKEGVLGVFDSERGEAGEESEMNGRLVEFMWSGDFGVVLAGLWGME
jgi:hypothetical protein